MICTLCRIPDDYHYKSSIISISIERLTDPTPCIVTSVRYLSFQGVLAWRGGGPQGVGGVPLFHHGPPVEARVTGGPAAGTYDVRAAAAHQPVGAGVALLAVLQLSLGQAVGCKHGVPGLLAQGAGLWDGRVWGWVSGSGVVDLGPHDGSSGGACGRKASIKPWCHVFGIGWRC